MLQIKVSLTRLTLSIYVQVDLLLQVLLAKLGGSVENSTQDENWDKSTVVMQQCGRQQV